jgi:hypothetical protein
VETVSHHFDDEQKAVATGVTRNSSMSTFNPVSVRFNPPSRSNLPPKRSNRSI